VDDPFHFRLEVVTFPFIRLPGFLALAASGSASRISTGQARHGTRSAPGVVERSSHFSHEVVTFLFIRLPGFLAVAAGSPFGHRPEG
jgi:hypothetical protein